jgi:hypothetical protein
MQTSTSPFVDEEQLSPLRQRDSRTLLKPQTRQPEMQGYAAKSDPAFAFRAFTNTVDRLERLLDQETAALRENTLITLDDFNQKKSHGLLELRRTIGGIRELRFANLGLDPKPALARLRAKLQNNLTVLQTHLDAVAAISAIIARTIEEQESDGTYTPDDTRETRRR